MHRLYVTAAALYTLAGALLVPAGIVEHDLGLTGGGLCACALAVETVRREHSRRTR